MDNAIFQSNKDALSFFNQWQQEVMANKTDKNKGKKLLSSECRDDLNSSVVGFHNMCDNVLSSKRTSVVPKHINNDVVENVFSQQGSLHNGSSTNPTYHQYTSTMNSILIGRRTMFRNNNSSELPQSIGCKIQKVKKIRI